MPTVEILNSHPVSVLRKEIAKSNDKLGIIKGYSKGLKKAGIIDLMMKHKSRFHHIKMAEKKEPAPKKAPKPATAQEIKDSLMVPGKYTAAEIKAGKALVKNQPKKEEKERKENYNDESDNLKLYEEGKKNMTLKTHDRLVKRIDDMKLYLKDYDDLTKRLEKLKPVEPKKEKAQKIADSLDKPSKKSLIEQMKDLPDHPDVKPPKKPKRERSEKQKANDKKLGEAAKARAAAKDKK